MSDRMWGFVWVLGALAGCSPSSGGGGQFVDCNAFPTAPICGGGGGNATHGTGADTNGGDSSQCVADCAGKSCGPDGCGHFCGSCTAGTTCIDGGCVQGECGAGGLTVHGNFAVASGISFDHVTVALVHKMDVDAFEDGCLTSLRVELGRGLGCTLVVEAANAIAAEGGLRVTRLAFSADSQCPGFPDDREGRYEDLAGMEVMLIVPEAYKVPDRNAPNACLVTNLEVRLAGVLHDQFGGALEVGATSLMISGEMNSLGSTTAQCPCKATCSDKECGKDGCGYECGQCGADERCDLTAGLCECVPSCAGKQCGDDGCGGTCGAGCQGADSCQDGRCVACQPSCDGKVCGDNGCGGTCGACQAGLACSDGQCACQPNCAGKTCGSDGCGGSCGACDAGESCTAGACVCAPNCAGKACGDDGCGGSCGGCELGGTCDASGQCPSGGGGACNGTCDGLDALICPSDCAACGDGTCQPTENHTNCAADCKVGCGDGQCKTGETADNCAYDCTSCGDGICVAAEFASCPTDCIHFPGAQ